MHKHITVTSISFTMFAAVQGPRTKYSDSDIAFETDKQKFELELELTEMAIMRITFVSVPSPCYLWTTLSWKCIALVMKFG